MFAFLQKDKNLIIVAFIQGAGVRAINFLSDHILTASGLDAEVCMWDLRMVAANGAGGLLHK